MDLTSGFILTSLAIIQVVLTIIALSTNYWIAYSDAVDYTDDLSRGLWAYCRVNGCVNFTEFTASAPMKAVRAFMFLSWLYGLVGALLAGRMTCGKPDKKFFIRAVFVEIALFLFIGMIVYTAENSGFVASHPRAAWGYSFVIGWIAFIVSLPAAVLSIWFTRSTKQVDSNKA